MLEWMDSDLSYRNKIKVMSLNDNILYKEFRDFRDIYVIGGVFICILVCFSDFCDVVEG